MKCPICEKQLKEKSIVGFGCRKDILKCEKGHFKIISDIHTVSYKVGNQIVSMSRVESISGYNRLRRKVNKLVKQYKQPQKVRRLK